MIDYFFKYLYSNYLYPWIWNFFLYATDFFRIQKRIILFSRIKKTCIFLIFIRIWWILFIGEGGGLHRFREESIIKRRKARRLLRIRRSLYHLRNGGDGFWGWMRFEACGKKAFRPWLTMSDWHLWRWMNWCENENEWRDAFG